MGDKNLKILIIPSADLSYDSGSVIYAKKLFTYLLKHGHEVYMLSNCVPKDFTSYEKKHIVVKENLLFHPIINDREVNDWMYFAMCKEIIDAAETIMKQIGKFDVIHAHYASINSYAASVIHNLLNIPYVISSFGRDLTIGYYYDHRIRNFIYKSYIDAKYIITPDSSIKKAIENKFSVDIIDNKVSIIPMPVDNEIFKQGTLKMINTNNRIVITSINSCFTEEKGIKIIIDAFSLVLKEYDAILYIAGDDDDDDKINLRELKERVKKLNIENNVIFLGYLSRSNVGELLRKTDIFVDARINGNFSSVLLEAQFLNVVSIVSESGFSRNIINGGNGVLFKSGDAQDLYFHIKEIIENIKIGKDIKKATKMWVKHNGYRFSEEFCFQKMEKIYSDCIN